MMKLIRQNLVFSIIILAILFFDFSSSLIGFAQANVQGSQSSLGQIQKYYQLALNKKITTLAQVRQIETAFREVYAAGETVKNKATISKGLFLQEISSSLVEQAMAAKDLPRTSESKLYYLLLENVKEALGENSRILSDATVTHNDSSTAVFFVIYSNRQFNDAKQIGDFGIFFTRTYLGQADSLDQKTLEQNWNVEGSQYRANLKVSRVVDAEKWVKGKDSPKYLEYRSDGVIDTLMVADQTTLNKESNGTTIAFMEFSSLYFYLLKLGYTFETNGKDPQFVSSYPLIPDSKQYLKDRIIGNGAQIPVDILYKIAHNGGEDKLFLRLPKTMRKMRATLKKPDGILEVFEYIFPESLVSKKPNLSYYPILTSEVGSWVRARALKNQNELLYINTSCNSYKQAVFELPAMRTPKNSVTMIASDSDIYTFSPSPWSATFQLVEALNKGENYNLMRQRLNITKRAYPAGDQAKLKDKLIYLLPNEEAFKNEILQFALEVDLKVEKLNNSNGSWGDNPLMTINE